MLNEQEIKTLIARIDALSAAVTYTVNALSVIAPGAKKEIIGAIVKSIPQQKDQEHTVAFAEMARIIEDVKIG